MHQYLTIIASTKKKLTYLTARRLTKLSDVVQLICPVPLDPYQSAEEIGEYIQYYPWLYDGIVLVTDSALTPSGMILAADSSNDTLDGFVSVCGAVGGSGGLMDALVGKIAHPLNRSVPQKTHCPSLNLYPQFDFASPAVRTGFTDQASSVNWTIEQTIWFAPQTATEIATFVAYEAFDFDLGYQQSKGKLYSTSLSGS